MVTTRNSKNLDHQTLSGKLGISLDSTSIARSISPRWRSYHEDGRSSGVPKTIEMEAVDQAGGAPNTVRIQQDDDKLSKTLSELGTYGRSLVMSVLKKQGECGMNDLREFLSMHNGVRELRLRNLRSSMWETLSSAKEVSDNFSALDSWRQYFHSTCGIREPSPEEKMQAVSDPAELTGSQRSLIANEYGIGSNAITAGHVSGMRNYLASIPESERPAFWRKNRVDLMALSGLVHKIRFALIPESSDQAPNLHFNQNEISILSGIMMASHDKSIDIGSLRNSFNEMSYQKIIKKAFNGQSHYRKEVVAAWLLSSRHQFGLASIPESAQLESEYHTLLDFFGLPAAKASGALDYRFGATIAKKDKDGATNLVNDDCFSGAFVFSSGAEPIRLDAIWDGMAGHNDGAMASRIAKDTLEICAIAGWIRTPEDVRKAFVMADIAIVFTQLSNKYNIADPAFKDPANLENVRQDDSMGTTGLVVFQQGDRIFVIHCGDSDFKLIEGGKNIYNHVYHDSQYPIKLLMMEAEAEKYLQAKANEKGLVTQNMGSSASIWLKDNIRSLAEDKLLSERPAQAVDNIVSAALGGRARYITINGKTNSYLPLTARDGQTRILSSDGISDVACEHEYAEIVSLCDGDPAKVRERLMALARSREDPAQATPIISCGCTRHGKNDDKTIVVVPSSLK